MAERLEWHDAFAVGHTTLDAQHREFVNHINRIYKALDAKEPTERWQDHLDVLMQAAKAHFAYESAVLGDVVGSASTPKGAKAVGEAVIREHIVAHDSALAELGAIVANIARSVPEELPQLGEQLVRWFIDHSIKHDAHLKTVFQAM
ncbi:MAG: hemerythrin domain-containing protein [Alphaproteobacteria bacterium]|nr:hemerythrin domain-containing protein [Alphaproteobacteria bacterium]